MLYRVVQFLRVEPRPKIIPSQNEFDPLISFNIIHLFRRHWPSALFEAAYRPTVIFILCHYSTSIYHDNYRHRSDIVGFSSAHGMMVTKNQKSSSSGRRCLNSNQIAQLKDETFLCSIFFCKRLGVIVRYYIRHLIVPACSMAIKHFESYNPCNITRPALKNLGSAYFFYVKAETKPCLLVGLPVTHLIVRLHVNVTLS